MATVEDVLARIRQHLPGAGDMALCKLAYYTQAWHLTWEGRELFPERIEAWRDGPVPRAAYAVLKDGRFGNADTLTPTEQEVVDAVIEFYGSRSGWELRCLSHDEAPWQEARAGLPEGAPSQRPISVASMRRYYTRQSMSGKSVPTRGRSYVGATAGQALAAAEAEVPRWKGTLARLADR